MGSCEVCKKKSFCTKTIGYVFGGCNTDYEELDHGDRVLGEGVQ